MQKAFRGVFFVQGGGRWKSWYKPPLGQFFQ
uniref:Uncharacterized protein n=1 Tax=Myoviridae sp. ctOv05 TaxID=2825094 RepID=A0A8S5P6D8_9CAUD|nr:MAG TPA: hypothetical protein [Myoviridae sp. ctOv05]